MKRLFLLLALTLMLPSLAGAADWNKPVSTDTYLNVLTYLKDRDNAAGTLFKDSTPSNLVDGAVRLNRSTGRFETYSAAGSSWSALSVSVSSADSASAAADSNLLKGVDHRGVGGTAEHPAATTGTAGFMSAADKSKLNGIETGATGDQTASEILAAIKTVDGAGSGLDADLIDGQDPAFLSPIGSITLYGGSTAPNGWLLCQGQAVSRTTYSALYMVIGTTYGAGNGSTTFNLPDLRGRAPIGAGQGVGLTNRTLGSKAGEETHLLSVSEMPAHNHPGSDSASEGAHQHTMSPFVENGSGGFTYTAAASQENTTSVFLTTGAAGAHDHALTIASQGSGAAHNNMQPFIALNYIIKY